MANARLIELLDRFSTPLPFTVLWEHISRADRHRDEANRLAALQLKINDEHVARGKTGEPQNVQFQITYQNGKVVHRLDRVKEEREFESIERGAAQPRIDEWFELQCELRDLDPILEGKLPLLDLGKPDERLANGEAITLSDKVRAIRGEVIAARKPAGGKTKKKEKGREREMEQQILEQIRIHGPKAKTETIVSAVTGRRADKLRILRELKKQTSKKHK